MVLKTLELIIQGIYLHCPILIPLTALFSKRIRAKWQFLLVGVIFQTLATYGIYLFVWYNKSAGYRDWLHGWFLYYPVNIISILVYVIIIFFILKFSKTKETGGG